MTGLVWLTVPLMVLAFSAIVGIPLWLTFQRPETYPDYAEARAHYRAKARLAHVAAVAAGRAADGALSLARQHAAAQEPVPGRRHAVRGRRPPSARPGRRAEYPRTDKPTRAPAGGRGRGSLARSAGLGQPAAGRAPVPAGRPARSSRSSSTAPKPRTANDR